MILHPEVRKWLQFLESGGSSGDEILSVSSIRKEMDMGSTGIRPDVRVEDIEIPMPDRQLEARHYSLLENRHALLFLHGGGFIAGNLDMYDALCSTLTIATGMDVFSLDYRLAPENRFPAALEDAYRTVQWLSSEGYDEISVVGDSAGGNIAAALCIMIRNRQGARLYRQVLVYPATNMLDISISMLEFSEGYGLKMKEAVWFSEQYVRDMEERLNPYASPLLEMDLSGLPDALIITAEYDILRDQGEEYAKKLLLAGNRCTSLRLLGTVHGFLSMNPSLSPCREAVGAIAAFLGRGAYYAKI